MSNDVASVINEASVDAPPTIALPERTSATLIKGFPGVPLFAEVRELNGADEEFIAGIEAKPGVNYGDWLTAVLQRSVVSVGGQPPGDLDTLINPDRDILMLATVRATYGPVKNVRATCQSCRKKNDVEINLDEDFPVALPDFDVNEPIEVSLPGKGTVRLNLPTGADTSACAAAKNDVVADTLLLSRCAVFTDAAPADRLDWARNLNTGLRRKAIDALLNVELGPKLEVVETHCAHCEEPLIIGLNWVSLLFG